MDMIQLKNKKNEISFEDRIDQSVKNFDKQIKDYENFVEENE